MSDGGDGDFGYAVGGEEDDSFDDGLGTLGQTDDNGVGAGREDGGAFGDDYPAEGGSHSQGGDLGSLGEAGDGGSSWLPDAALIGAGATIGAAGMYVGHDEMKRRWEGRERHTRHEFDDDKRWRWERERWGHGGCETAAGTSAGICGGSDGGRLYVGLDEAMLHEQRHRLRDHHHDDDVIVASSEATWGSQPPLSQRHRRDAAGGCLGMCVGLCNMFLLAALLWVYLSTYGSHEIELGMHESRLYTAFPLFASSIEVVNVGPRGSGTGVMVYGLDKQPKLSKRNNWHSDKPNIVIPGARYKNWAFWLNRGSKVVVHYIVGSETGVTFVILKGAYRLREWASSPVAFQDWEYKAFLKTGRGLAPGLGEGPFIVPSDGDYYFVFGNTQRRSEARLDITFVAESMVYDVGHSTDEADRNDSNDDDDVTECEVRKYGRCVIPMRLLRRQYAVLTTPDTYLGATVWNMRIEYGARWRVYVFFIGLSIFISFLVIVWMRVRRQFAEGGDDYDEVPTHSPHYFPSYQAVPGQVTDRGGFQDSGLPSPGMWRPIPPPPPPASDITFPYAPAAYPSQLPTASTSPVIFPTPDLSSHMPSTEYIPRGVYPTDGIIDPTMGVMPSAPPIEAAARPPWNLTEDDQAAKKAASRPWNSTEDEERTSQNVSGTAGENPCVVCLDAIKDAIFDPCGHRAACHPCGIRLWQSKQPLCPICRSEIHQVIKVFDT